LLAFYQRWADWRSRCEWLSKTAVKTAAAVCNNCSKWRVSLWILISTQTCRSLPYGRWNQQPTQNA